MKGSLGREVGESLLLLALTAVTTISTVGFGLLATRWLS